MLDEKALYEEIGSRIKKARKGLGFSQSELASRINLKRTSITNIEKGGQKVTIATLYNICSSLQLDLESLLPNLEDFTLHSVQVSTESEEKIGSKTLVVLEQYRRKLI